MWCDDPRAHGQQLLDDVAREAPDVYVDPQRPVVGRIERSVDEMIAHDRQVRAPRALSVRHPTRRTLDLGAGVAARQHDAAIVRTVLRRDLVEVLPGPVPAVSFAEYQFDR